MDRRFGSRPVSSFAFTDCLRLPLLRIEAILLNLDEESLLESERVH
jgi:hypothetical protein